MNKSHSLFFNSLIYEIDSYKEWKTQLYNSLVSFIWANIMLYNFEFMR